jgi:hypothetical protein
MKLAFYAAPGHQVQSKTAYQDQPASYINRKAVLVDATDYQGKPCKVATYPATEEPWRCESSSPIVRKLRRAVVKGKVLPADKETAAFCGVTYRKLAHSPEGWVPAPTAAARPPRKEGDK